MVKPEGPPGPAVDEPRDLAAHDDAALLERYVGTRDPQAFAELAARHGPLVFRTCLRALGNVHDAEDATQAVFLVLARRPHKARGCPAGWLHKVARDTALTLLRSRARRARREEEAAMRNAAPPGPDADGLREELDEAVGRLPPHLREPVILCYLEGRRQDEAARMLGCHQGTLSRRAADGLERLRGLLARRGVVVTSAALAGCLLQQQAQAAVPTALVGSLKMAASGAAASAKAGALADATLKAAAVAKVKTAAVAVAAAAALGTAVALVALPGPPPRDAIPLASFDGPAVPTNRAGAGYPSAAPDDGSAFAASIELDGVTGNCLRMRLTSGRLKAQFDPDERTRKTFTRDFVGDPARWRFDHYNRLRFWLRRPTSARPHRADGSSNLFVGAYVKRVKDADFKSLDAGGGAYCFALNVPAAGCWTQVVLAAHPTDRLGRVEARDLGVLAHPTGEPGVNFFDALTRFFVEDREAPASYPADYGLDDVEFYAEARPENDAQVYGLTATHVPAENRVIVTWNRNKDDAAVAHEVRYAFRDVHGSGWESARPAPGGVVRPAARAENNGMVYDTRELPLAGQKTLYLAIKPQNAAAFSQIEVPLTLK